VVNVDESAASIFGMIGTAVSLLAATPYARAIYRRTVRPHLFTWLVWSVVTAIAAAGLFVAGAGPSAWCTGGDCRHVLSDADRQPVSRRARLDGFRRRSLSNAR